MSSLSRAHDDLAALGLAPESHDRSKPPRVSSSSAMTARRRARDDDQTTPFSRTGPFAARAAVEFISGAEETRRMDSAELRLLLDSAQRDDDARLPASRPPQSDVVPIPAEVTAEAQSGAFTGVLRPVAHQGSDLVGQVQVWPLPTLDPASPALTTVAHAPLVATTAPAQLRGARVGRLSRIHSVIGSLLRAVGALLGPVIVRGLAVVRRPKPARKPIPALPADLGPVTEPERNA